MKAYQGFKVDQSVLEAFKREAARQSRSVSNLLALIITDFVNKLEIGKESSK